MSSVDMEGKLPYLLLGPREFQPEAVAESQRAYIPETNMLYGCSYASTVRWICTNVVKSLQTPH